MRPTAISKFSLKTEVGGDFAAPWERQSCGAPLRIGCPFLFPELNLDSEVERDFGRIRLPVGVRPLGRLEGPWTRLKPVLQPGGIPVQGWKF